MHFKIWAMLFERNIDGNIFEVPYIDVWFIVDNGYLAWSCTVPPIKKWYNPRRNTIFRVVGILEEGC